MEDRYFFRQLLLILNQAAVIVYLCFMTAIGNIIGSDNKFHFFMLSLLLWDAVYISYQNVKSNSVLNHFSYLLVLLGWQFLLSLFNLSAGTSIFLLPLCLYQSFYFIQDFLFQASAYRWKKHFLLLCKSICVLSEIAFFISSTAFAITYQIQFLLSLVAILIIGIVHRQRICFVMQSHKRELLFSAFFVGFPFMCYVIVFHRQSGYMASMGSYFAVLLAFFSVHNIVFQYHTRREWISTLKAKYKIILTVLGFAGLGFVIYLFQIPLMALFVLSHIFALLVMVFNLFLYLQIREQPKDFDNPTDRQHFYVYSLAQIKREEMLKKEFSNYLHDNILQDLLSIKNLVRKADQPDIQQLLYDTLGELYTSIRSQMQAYHPPLLKSLTLKENIQSLLDTLTENSPVSTVLDCSDTVFLVEPYNILVYRMIRELVTNVLKHSYATKIWVLLMQEHGTISLKVSDNGTGFETLSYRQPEHQGLASIQEQVGLLNGVMAIQSHSGTGTQITITMPMRGEDSYESFISR